MGEITSEDDLYGFMDFESPPKRRIWASGGGEERGRSGERGEVGRKMKNWVSRWHLSRHCHATSVNVTRQTYHANLQLPRMPSTLARRAREGLCSRFGHAKVGDVTVWFCHAREGGVAKEVRIGNKVRDGLTLKY